MDVITLITDFGLNDEYAGVMKGSILSENPRVQVVDICHSIPPFDTVAAARMAKASFPYFPEHTVHVIVVDPGVGSSRSIVAFEMESHVFLCPDNGIPSFIIAGSKASSIVRVENPAFFRKKVSTTFHGRDLFAPVAAKIADGADLSHLGRQVDASTLVRFDISGPTVTASGEITGRITSIDHFGNLITDIPGDLIRGTFHDLDDLFIEIMNTDKPIKGVSDHYQAVEEKEPVALVGSRGYLEIAVHAGSAERYFSSAEGGLVKIIQTERMQTITKEISNDNH